MTWVGYDPNLLRDLDTSGLATDPPPRLFAAFGSRQGVGGAAARASYGGTSGS